MRSVSMSGPRTDRARLLTAALLAAHHAWARRRLAAVRSAADGRVAEVSATADRRVAEAELTAAEHAELHQLVGLVARGASLTDVCTGVARAGVVLLGGQVGLVVRLDDPRGEIVGRHLDAPVEGYPAIGEYLRFDPASAVGQVLGSGHAARAHQGAASPFASALGQRVAAPIALDGELWGAVAVSSVPGRTLPEDAEARLGRFAELVALAIGNAEARQRLVRAANTDALTGLANHRIFQTRLEDEVAQAHCDGQPLSLALIDIDRFKQINDTFGHLAGDRVLAEIAVRLRTTMRGDVVLARIGGDEFAAVLPCTDGTEAAEVSTRLHQVVRDTPVDGDLRVTVSIGVSELVAGGDAHDLRQRADDALYAAKRGGRDAVRSERAASHGPGDALQSTGR